MLQHNSIFSNRGVRPEHPMQMPMYTTDIFARSMSLIQLATWTNTKFSIFATAKIFSRINQPHPKVMKWACLIMSYEQLHEKLLFFKKSSIFGDITPCNPKKINCVRGTCHFCLQGQRITEASNQNEVDGKKSLSGSNMFNWNIRWFWMDCNVLYPRWQNCL